MFGRDAADNDDAEIAGSRAASNMSARIIKHHHGGIGKRAALSSLLAAGVTPANHLPRCFQQISGRLRIAFRGRPHYDHSAPLQGPALPPPAQKSRPDQETRDGSTRFDAVRMFSRVVDGRGRVGSESRRLASVRRTTAERHFIEHRAASPVARSGAARGLASRHCGRGYASVAVAGGRVFTQGDLQGVEHVIALSAADGRVLWQVQPASVAKLLDQRIQEQMERLDKNGNNVLDEVEALQGFGWDFNKFDRGGPSETEAVRVAAALRASDLIAALDKNDDGKLDFDELGKFLSGRPRLSDLDNSDDAADVDAEAERRTATLMGALDQGSGRPHQPQRVAKKRTGSRVRPGRSTRTGPGPRRRLRHARRAASVFEKVPARHGRGDRVQ